MIAFLLYIAHAVALEKTDIRSDMHLRTSSLGDIRRAIDQMGEAPSSTTPTISGTLPSSGEYLIKQQKQDSAWYCMIMGGYNKDLHPSRFLWASSDSLAEDDKCGLSTRGQLLSNGQAIWTLESLGGDLYLIRQMQDKKWHCLSFGNTEGRGDNWDAYPSRQLWGSSEDNCGFSSRSALLADGQAIWKLEPLGSDKYAIRQKLGKTWYCLAFYHNNTDEHPKRQPQLFYDDNCGFSSRDALLANGQAVWKLENPYHGSVREQCTSTYCYSHAVNFSQVTVTSPATKCPTLNSVDIGFVQTGEAPNGTENASTSLGRLLSDAEARVANKSVGTVKTGPMTNGTDNGSTVRTGLMTNGTDNASTATATTTEGWSDYLKEVGNEIGSAAVSAGSAVGSAAAAAGSAVGSAAASAGSAVGSAAAAAGSAVGSAAASVGSAVGSAVGSEGQNGTSGSGGSWFDFIPGVAQIAQYAVGPGEETTTTSTTSDGDLPALKMSGSSSTANHHWYDFLMGGPEDQPPVCTEQVGTSGDIRSGNKEKSSTMTLPGNISLSPGEAFEMTYVYVVGYGCEDTPRGPSFDVYIGGTKVGTTQGPFTDYPFDNCEGRGCPTCYSDERAMKATASSAVSGQVEIRFTNNDRNMHLKVVTASKENPPQSPTPSPAPTTTAAPTPSWPEQDPYRSTPVIDGESYRRRGK